MKLEEIFGEKKLETNMDHIFLLVMLLKDVKMKATRGKHTKVSIFIDTQLSCIGSHILQLGSFFFT